MKAHPVQPLLCLRITDLVDLEDLLVVLEAPERECMAAQLIVRASWRAWSAPIYCGTQDPVAFLASMSAPQLRDALSYSRPSAKHEGCMAHEISQVIPQAVQLYLDCRQPAPAEETSP